MEKQIKSFQQEHKGYFDKPNATDFEIIKTFLKSEDVKPEDLFVYPIRLCDNIKDRDDEKFSDIALTSICSKAVGVVGIKNHEWNSENAHSRIYKAEIEEIDGIKSVVGYAYTLVTNSNIEFINNIKSGLLQEVSIGFSAKSYSEENGTKIIDDVTDLYEWSFVAVPAQPKAGVIKSKKGVKSMELEARIKELEAEVETKSVRVKELEANVSVKEAKIKELQESIVETAIKGAISSVKSAFKFKGCKAEEIADGVIRDIVSITEDGTIEGCDVAEETLKADYDFLFEPDDAEKGCDEEEKEEKEENSDDDEVEVKNYAVIADNIVKKSKAIDFTYIKK